MIVQPQAQENLPGSVRVIEGIEMDAAYAVVEKVAALLGSPVDADATHRFRVILATLDGTQQGGREACTGCQVGHAFHAFNRGDGHDAGNDRYFDAGQFTSLAKIVEVAVVEKQLGADVVGTFIDLGLEIVHLQQAVGCCGMPLGKTGYADTETASIRMKPLVVELADETYQIGGVGKSVLGPIVMRDIGRGIAGQSQDIADAGFRITLEDLTNFLLGAADAGEVRRRIEGAMLLNAHDQVVGSLAGRAAGTVGDRGEVRIEGFQLANGFVQTLGALSVFGGKNSKENVVAYRAKIS